MNSFLIAALHVKALEECDTVMELKQAADTQLTDIKTLYKNAVERIKHMKPDRARVGLMALLWVTHAKQPLHMHELQEALGTEYTTGSSKLDGLTVMPFPRRMSSSPPPVDC